MRDPITDADDILSSIGKEEPKQEPKQENQASLDHSVPLKPSEEEITFDKILPGNLQKNKKTRGRKPKEVSKVNPELLENECDKMMQEMEAAYLADLENNQVGKPALNKLKVLDKVTSKLNNSVFAEIFLDKNGLEQFHNFLKRLPDGSWPLSSIRQKIFQTLLILPYTEHHLKYTKLGKTLTLLQKSKSEYEENKKLIQMIKDKWSRIVCGISMNYKHLENAEKENYKLMKKKRKRTTARNFGANFVDQKLTQNTNTRKVKMGYNFTIRPNHSVLGKRELPKSYDAKNLEVEKFLTKMRKVTKTQML